MYNLLSCVLSFISSFTCFHVYDLFSVGISYNFVVAIVSYVLVEF